MNLDQIESFLVLADVCHFGEAARRLDLSQPSLTKQIGRLEDVLGASLFRRGRQGTELTAFGRLFLEEVKPVLRHADHVWAKSRRTATGDRGPIAIGFTFSSAEVMARIVVGFKKRYPGIEITFDDISSSTQVERIREGSLDVGFMRLPVEDDLASYPATHDRLALVFPASMAGDIDSFDSAAIRVLPFVGLTLGLAPGLESYVQRYFKAKGFHPKVMHRVNGAQTQLALVASGVAIALMHQSALRGAAKASSRIGVRAIVDPLTRWEEGLVWRHEERNPVVIRFLRAARDTLRPCRGKRHDASTAFPLIHRATASHGR